MKSLIILMVAVLLVGCGPEKVVSFDCEGADQNAILEFKKECFQSNWRTPMQCQYRAEALYCKKVVTYEK